jgi:hypothetical protein
VKQVAFQNGTTAGYTYSGFRGEVSRIHHETSGPATILRSDTVPRPTTTDPMREHAHALGSRHGTTPPAGR